MSRFRNGTTQSNFRIYSTTPINKSISVHTPQSNTRNVIQNTMRQTIHIEKPYLSIHQKDIKNKKPLLLKTQIINDHVDVVKAKRCKTVSHRTRIKCTPNVANNVLLTAKPFQILDGFMLINSCKVKNPHQATRAKISCKNISEVVEEDLNFFDNLTYLNASENKIKLKQLTNLRNLRELILQYNNIKSIEITNNDFPKLEVLDLAYNAIPPGSILQLSWLPNLKYIDLTANELCILPEDMSSFANLEDLNLSSNKFSSNSVAVDPGKIIRSLSTIPHLRKLNLSHNMFQS